MVQFNAAVVHEFAVTDVVALRVVGIRAFVVSIAVLGDVVVLVVVGVVVVVNAAVVGVTVSFVPVNIELLNGVELSISTEESMWKPVKFLQV